MATGSTASSTRALAALAVPVVAAIAAAICTQAHAQPRSAVGASAHGPYPWPVKPFDQPHPVRGNFGDPRTVFDGPLSRKTLMSSGGVFTFHQGVDISAPDGTPVYPVTSGQVIEVRTSGAVVTVRSAGSRTFQYWHLEPRVVRVGQSVVAGRTVLGYVQRKREHVHLTHFENGRVVNPLAPGRLTPYRDYTAPEVRSITLRRAGGSARLVQFVADAIDRPAKPVPGRWNGYPVTPACVTWRIERAGSVVVPTQIAHDIRETLPPGQRFWSTFARGSHQNWPVFAGVKIQHLAGRYLFKLTTTPFDARRLARGRYELIVTAMDAAGNRGSRRVALVVTGAGVARIEQRPAH
jgi:murein DD-endopeptidase MepM/ murein hydrolase activator NlpD